jgi:hypothetical protein
MVGKTLFFMVWSFEEQVAGLLLYCQNLGTHLTTDFLYNLLSLA